jgi:hypothetical protein
MDHQNVSFKAVLKVGDDNSEIRRFVVDRDVSTSLDYLREKLSTIFSELRRKDFRYFFVLEKVIDIQTDQQT